MSNEKTTFEKLNAIDIKDHVEKKNGLDYLSWAWAWAEFKKAYPDADYSVVKFNGLPYVYDPQSGIMCYTTVTANGETLEMWLPVMDSSNKALKFVPQTFKFWNSKKNAYEEKTIPAATMFDVNKTIMRCLVKNMAMFGLGLSLYVGEDIPNEVGQTSAPESSQQPASAPATQQKPVIENGDMIKVAKALAEAHLQQNQDKWNKAVDKANKKWQISQATWDKISAMMQNEINMLSNNQ